MSKTRTKVVLALVVFGGWTVVACTAGVGSPPDIGQAYGDKPGPFGAADKPGTNGRDTPPGQGAGSNGGTTSTSGGNSSSGDPQGGCPPCDGTITCEVTATGTATQKVPLPLKTKNGVCVLESSSGDIVFACGGGLTLNGQAAGTWKNCTKGSANPPATGTATAVPTTTSTPVDAGTRG